MADSPHFKELLQLFNEKKVEYLIVGGYAVMKYTEPRFTKDLVLWIRNEAGNPLFRYFSVARISAIEKRPPRGRRARNGRIAGDLVSSALSTEPFQPTSL